MITLYAQVGYSASRTGVRRDYKRAAVRIYFLLSLWYIIFRNLRLLYIFLLYFFFGVRRVQIGITCLSRTYWSRRTCAAKLFRPSA